MTLTEVLVATFLLALFGLAATAALTLAMRQWNQVGQRVNAVQNARYITTAIATELRTAVPAPCTSLGWQTVSPKLGIGNTTAVLIPNFNTTGGAGAAFVNPPSQQVSSALNFTKPAPTYNPTAAGFDITSPTLYKAVQYSSGSSGGVYNVTRVSYSYSAGGTATLDSSDVIATGSNISLQFRWLSDSVYNVSVTAQEGLENQPGPVRYRYNSTYNTTVMVLGQ